MRKILFEHADGATPDPLPSSRMARQILSIAAATGWSAELSADDDFSPDRRVTLVGWALVESDEGEREVVGLVLHPRGEDDPTGRIGLVDEVPGFIGYAFGGVRTQAN
jgi:hypothetical protein